MKRRLVVCSTCEAVRRQTLGCTGSPKLALPSRSGSKPTSGRVGAEALVLPIRRRMTKKKEKKVHTTVTPHCIFILRESFPGRRQSGHIGCAIVFSARVFHNGKASYTPRTDRHLFSIHGLALLGQIDSSSV